MGRLLQHLEPHGALASHHPRVGEGMDVGQALVLGPGPGHLVCVVPARALDHHLGSPSAELLDLGRWRDLGQVDVSLGAGGVGGVSHGEAVVTAGGGDHAAIDLGVR